MKDEMTNGYALITGATSGIGYELAKVFAEARFDLVIVARSDDDLQRVSTELTTRHGVDVVAIAADLFDPRAPFRIHDEVKSKGITVDVLVNNAGQGQYGLFVETDIHRQLEIIQLNVSSLTALTHVFLGDMLQRNSGRILQVASIASNLPGPLQAVYHGTKAYVLSFTEALINELKGTEIVMTALQPGVTDTDFFNKADAQNSKLVEDKSKMADPGKVARDGFEALMRGDDKIISGMKNKAMVAASHIMPDSANAATIRRMSEEQAPEVRRGGSGRHGTDPDENLNPEE